MLILLLMEDLQQPITITQLMLSEAVQTSEPCGSSGRSDACSLYRLAAFVRIFADSPGFDKLADCFFTHAASPDLAPMCLARYVLRIC